MKDFTNAARRVLAPVNKGHLITFSRGVLSLAVRSQMRSRCPLIVAAIAAGLMTSCSVGPNYKGPPPVTTADVPRHYKNRSARDDELGRWKVAEPRDVDCRKGWWTIFHDCELNRLEDCALLANQDVRIALIRIAESRAQSRTTAASFLPQINLDGSTRRQRLSNTEAAQRAQILHSGGVVPAGGIFSEQPLTTTFNTIRFPFDLSWEIDLFGRVRRSYEAAHALSQQSEADFQSMLLSVTSNVASTYFGLRSLDAEIEVLLATIQTRKDALKIANERLSAGLTSELDVVRAQSNLASNEADLCTVRRLRSESENNLATLIGQPASVVRLGYRPLHQSPPRIPAGLPSRLLERRPDIASAERALAAANAKIGVAYAAFFPSIQLTGVSGFETADLGSVFAWQSRIWSIGPSVTLPIFEGGRNIANLGVSRAQYDEQVSQFRKQVLIAFQEVENALTDIRNYADQGSAIQRAVEASRRALTLSDDQYSKGSNTFLDVLDAERTLLTNERTAAQILGSRQQAAVQLIKALGGRW